MGFRSRNKKAKKNGYKAERVARGILLELLVTSEDAIEYINDLIDYYVNGEIPVEVKSCQEFIDDRTCSRKRRHGRFTLDKKQHEFLVKHDGYYLFIVHCTDATKLLKFVKARNLEYHDKITWSALERYIKSDQACPEDEK